MTETKNWYAVYTRPRWEKKVAEIFSSFGRVTCFLQPRISAPQLLRGEGHSGSAVAIGHGMMLGVNRFSQDAVRPLFYNCAGGA